MNPSQIMLRQSFGCHFLSDLLRRTISPSKYSSSPNLNSSVFHFKISLWLRLLLYKMVVGLKQWRPFGWTLLMERYRNANLLVTCDKTPLSMIICHTIQSCCLKLCCNSSYFEEFLQQIQMLHEQIMAAVSGKKSCQYAARLGVELFQIFTYFPRISSNESSPLPVCWRCFQQYSAFTHTSLIFF